ncbi:MAG: TrkH family potassium uptake protein [Parachlamydiales bacterium]|nr:TrkH family potassium uptake protein [Parachlamydiales bacterium]
MAGFYQFFSHSHPQPHSFFAFLWTLLICLAIAFILRIIGRKAPEQLYRRESILLVVFIWIITSLISSLPFIFSSTLKPLDAYFEAMSGLTTTGATMLTPKAYDGHTGEEIPILLTNPHVPEKTYIYYGTVPPVRDPDNGLILHTGIEAVSKALLFWRSLMQWIGGMGIVVIFLAVLPVLGVGGKLLYQMEATGPIKDEITPRVRETASQLWKLYSFFTLLQVALLVWTNKEMPFFDALCTSLSTISTGGFSVRNDSIASYNSISTESIVIAFMIIGSINFSLFFHILRFKFFKIYVPDFFLFIAIAGLGSIAVSAFLISDFGVSEAFRLGIFQAISLQTTTGFFSGNYDLWPFAPQMLMLLLMFVGGMSGSTAGGIKTPRFYIAYKILLHRLESIFRPDSVRKLYIGKNEVDDKNALTVLTFLCIVIFFVVIGALIFIFDGIDPETSLGLISSFLNNAGAAFRSAGPMDTVAFLSPFSKILSIFWMLLGRLEFFVVLLLFLPAFWRNR